VDLQPACFQREKRPGREVDALRRVGQSRNAADKWSVRGDTKGEILKRVIGSLSFKGMGPREKMLAEGDVYLFAAGR